jgi:hypothetical protein
MRRKTVERMLRNVCFFGEGKIVIPYDNTYQELCDEVFERMKGIPDEKVKNVESPEHRKYLDILKELYYRKTEKPEKVIKDNFDEYH